MSCVSPEIVAWRLKPPLDAMFAVPVAPTTAALAGNTSPTIWDVGATCTTCAVSAEEYHVKMRCDSSAPTPRMTPVRLAGVVSRRGQGGDAACHDGQTECHGGEPHRHSVAHELAGSRRVDGCHSLSRSSQITISEGLSGGVRLSASGESVMNLEMTLD